MSSTRVPGSDAARATAAAAAARKQASHLPSISTTRFNNLVGVSTTSHQQSPHLKTPSGVGTPRTTNKNNHNKANKVNSNNNSNSSFSSSEKFGSPTSLVPRPPPKTMTPLRTPTLQPRPPHVKQQQKQQQQQPLCTVLPVHGAQNTTRVKKTEKIAMGQRHSLTSAPACMVATNSGSAKLKKDPQDQQLAATLGGDASLPSTLSLPSNTELQFDQTQKIRDASTDDKNKTSNDIANTTATALAPAAEAAPESKTLLSESRYRKADASMMKFLRAFLKEREDKSKKLKRKSLPLTAFIAVADHTAAQHATDNTELDKGDNENKNVTCTATTKKDTEALIGAPPEMNSAAELYMALSEEEMLQLSVVLHDLHDFISFAGDNSVSFSAHPTNTMEVKDEAIETDQDESWEVDTQVDEDEEAFENVLLLDAATRAAETFTAATPTAHEGPPRKHRVTIVAPVSDANPSTDLTTGHTDVPEKDRRASERAPPAHDGPRRRRCDTPRRSAAGRFRETMAALEHAAGDCNVALRRVEEFSASLYTLVETWMHLHDNRFDEFARAVLGRLLTDNPTYAEIFYPKDVATQSVVVMDMIGRAVVAFTHPADMLDIMGEIGARHNLYGIRTEHYMALRKAFLEVYFDFVGPEMYDNSVDVWKMFWKSSIDFALSGASSERGEIYIQRRNVVWAERVKSIFAVLIPRQRSGGFHRLMQKTYEIATQRQQQQQHLNLDCLQQLGDLRTAHRTMEALIRITNSVTDGSAPPTSTEYNDQFSIQSFFTKSTIAFTADLMKQLEDPFLDACESYLAATDMWNIVVRSALQKLWSNYITGYWIAQPEQVKFGNAQSSAPDGKEPFCLMFTDIEASTRLWDSDAQSMSSAVITHHKLIRGLIEDFGGYEVKTVGDSFLIATHTVAQALLIAFGIQLELMTGPSAPGFHMVDNTQGGGDASCWRDDALRVRVGIHYCTDASAVYDSVHNRFDYYGPSVNCAARIEAAACGGQVLLSQEALTKLQGEELFDRQPVSSLFVDLTNKFKHAQEARGVEVMDDRLTCMSVAMQQSQRGTDAGDKTDTSHGVKDVPTLSALMHLEDAGCQVMKGIAEPVQLYSLLPAGLEGRDFQPKRDTVQSVMISNSSEEFAPWIEAETSPSSTTNNDTLTFSGCSFQVSSSPLMRPGEKKPQPAAF